MKPQTTEAVKYIWFNPENELYELGTREEYKTRRQNSHLWGYFSLILKVRPTYASSSAKAIEQLNLVRQEQIALPTE